MSGKRFKISSDGEGAWVLCDTEQPTVIAYYEKIENAYKDCLKLNEEYSTPRRTFEEIVKELKDKLGVFWSIEKLNKDYAVLANSTLDVFVVHQNGRLEIDYRHSINPTVKLLATQLAAISAACTEIADNYKAEQGKEEA